MPERRIIAARHPVLSTRLRSLLAILAAVATAVLSAPLLIDAPAAADPSGSGPYIQLDVDSVTPSMVTSTSGPTVRATGSIRNIADQPVSMLTIRLERGPRVTSAAGLRTGLTAGAPVTTGGEFTSIGRLLRAHEQRRFTLTMKLSGAGGLGIDTTGVYPLNVVLDGLDPSGVSVRLAESRTLLPVLSLPPDAGRAQQYVSPSSGGDGNIELGADGSVSANTAAPARLSVLWPLAAPPQLAPGVLGGATEPVRLISEDMARSLRPGGRLYTLLDALHHVVGPTDPNPGSTDAGSSAGSDSPNVTGTGTGSPAPTSAPGDSAPSMLEQSMCLAIDPDLLVTVRAMSRGYVVSHNPADPTSPTSPGGGRQAALDWLNTLGQIASRMCVVALPFAQADLSALSEIDNLGLTTSALRSPAEIVDAILGVTSVRGLVIPALGGISTAGADLLAANQTPRTVTAASTVAPSGGASDSGSYLVSGVHAQTFEVPVTAALGAMGTAPITPTLTPPDQQVAVAGESAGSRRETGLAALAYASIAVPDQTTSDTADSLPTTGRSSFVMPPTYWSATDADADALFSTATVLLGSGVAVPGPLSELPDQLDRAQNPAQLIDPAGVGPVASLTPQLSADEEASIRGATEQSFRLQSSLVNADDVEASPERYVAPLREDLLRSIRSPDDATTAVAEDLRARRTAAIRAVASTEQRMQQSVTILDPGGRYTLASERSPLLLVVRNSLALPVRVRLETTAPRELQIGDVGTIEIPANGTRQLQLPTRAGSSEALTVTITLSSSTGLPLGTPIRLSVHSNAYGKPLFWVTIVAGVALILLTARRLWHRFRGQPDPADADRPEPGEREKQLAGTTYQHRRRTLQHEGAHEPEAGTDDLPVDSDLPASNLPASNPITSNPTSPSTGPDRYPPSL